MDMSIIIVIWVVVMIIQSALEKKKPPPPTNIPSSTSPDFEIPTLANDPNFPNEEPIIFSDNPTQSAEVREINLAEIYRQKKSIQQPQPQNKIQVEEIEQNDFSLNLTPSATVNSIILGEILGKPKSRR